MTFDLDIRNGSLKAESSLPWTNLNSTFAVDHGSRFLYGSSPLYMIDSFNLDPITGVPTPSASLMLNGGICAFGCALPSAPGALAINPNGKFLFYGSSTLGGATEGVGSIAVNASTGALSIVPGSPFLASQVPFWVASHPSGKFVYTADLSSLVGGFTLQSVSGFAVDPTTGQLSSLPSSPLSVPANSKVFGLAVHPSGNFVYAPAGPATCILGWSVDPATRCTGSFAGIPS